MATETVLIVVLGEGGVGKTAVTIKMCLNHFVESYDPTIEDCYRKQVVIDEKQVTLEVLDTAGQEEFLGLRDQWIVHGDAFLIVYSIVERESFSSVIKYVERIARVKGIDYDFDENGNITEGYDSGGRATPAHQVPPIMVVGNKLDLATASARQISDADGSKIAAQLGCDFLETSAKTGVNVEKAFYTLVRMVREQQPGSRKGKKDPHKKSRCIIQ